MISGTKKKPANWPCLVILSLFCIYGWAKELTITDLNADDEKAIAFMKRLNTDDAFLKELPSARFFADESNELTLNESDVISAIYESWSARPKMASSGVVVQLDDFITLYPQHYGEVSVLSAVTPMGEEYLSLNDSGQLTWQKPVDNWQPPVDLGQVSLKSYLDLLMTLDRLDALPVAVTSYQVNLSLDNKFHRYRAAAIWAEYQGTLEPYFLDSVNITVDTFSSQAVSTESKESGSGSHSANQSVAGKSSGPACQVTTTPFTEFNPTVNKPLTNSMQSGTFIHDTAMDGDCKCSRSCRNECDIRNTLNSCFARVVGGSAFIRYISTPGESERTQQNVAYPNMANCQVRLACATQECVLGICQAVSISFAGASTTILGPSIVGKNSTSALYQCNACTVVDGDPCEGPDSNPAECVGVGPDGGGSGGGTGGGSGSGSGDGSNGNTGGGGNPGGGGGGGDPGSGGGSGTGGGSDPGPGDGPCQADGGIIVFCDGGFVGCAASVDDALAMCPDGDDGGGGGCPPGVPPDQCVALNHEFDLFRHARTQAGQNLWIAALNKSQQAANTIVN